MRYQTAPHPVDRPHGTRNDTDGPRKRQFTCDNARLFPGSGSSMAARLIEGKSLAASIKAQVRAEIEALAAGGLRRPGLAVVMVGQDPASAIYVQNKRKACDECGIASVAHDLPGSCTQDELLRLIDSL